MNSGFGMYPEAWLRMQQDEIERHLARRTAGQAARFRRRIRAPRLRLSRTPS